MTREQLIKAIKALRAADKDRPVMLPTFEEQLHPDESKNWLWSCRECQSTPTMDFFRTCTKCRRKLFFVGPPEPQRYRGQRTDDKPCRVANRTI